MPSFRHSPQAVVDYPLDWSRDLASGETILLSTWTVPDGLTKDSDSRTSTTTTVWLSGGTAGTVYAVRNKVTTSAGRTLEQTIHIEVERT